jgi:hypothetical protein
MIQNVFVRILLRATVYIKMLTAKSCILNTRHKCTPSIGYRKGYLKIQKDFQGVFNL